MSNTFGRTARRTESGPSRLWYVLAVVVAIAGMAGMGQFLVNQLTGLGDNLVQVVVPGEMELTLEPGDHTIFHERRSTVDGRVYSVEDIAGLGVTLISAAGEPVALEPPSMSSAYEFGGRSGVAAFDFEIGTAGDYRLSASYREGAPGPETVLAVGKGFGGDLLWTLLGAFAFAFGGIGLAIAIAATVYLKRRAAMEAGGQGARRA